MGELKELLIDLLRYITGIVIGTLVALAAIRFIIIPFAEFIGR